MISLNFRALRFPKIKPWLFFTLFAVFHIFILRNVYLMGRDMLSGDHSAENIVPAPAYALLRIPDTLITRHYEAQNRLAADFASLYFPSQHLDVLDKQYKKANFDLWNRPSNFAPLIHVLCAISICRLSFGSASVVFMGFEYLLFLAVYCASFRLLKIEKHTWLGLLLVNIFLFLSPTGLSLFERGQNYLFVGSAYLLLLTGFVKRNNWLILLSALLAFIRWTAFPFVLVSFCGYVINSKSLAEAWRKILVGGGFSLIILALFLFYRSLGILFLEQLSIYEKGSPDGISLATIFPTVLTKFLPFALIFLSAMLAKINNREFEQNIPFLAGSAILLLTYPTAPFEYSLASLLGFIPLLIYWTKQTGSFITNDEREIIKYIFLVFLLLATFSSLIIENIIYEYLLAAVILLILPVYFYWRAGPNRPFFPRQPVS